MCVKNTKSHLHCPHDAVIASTMGVACYFVDVVRPFKWHDIPMTIKNFRDMDVPRRGWDGMQQKSCEQKRWGDTGESLHTRY